LDAGRRRWESGRTKIGRGFANRRSTPSEWYGLKALMNGQITPAQFVDLNVKVGGHDIDTTPSPSAPWPIRRIGGHVSIRIPQRANNLDVPIIDVRGTSNVRSTIPTTAGRCVRASRRSNHDNQII
jgi:hypothetical protein